MQYTLQQVEAIEVFFTGADIPENIKLYDWLVITDPKKFVSGHIAAAKKFVGKPRLSGYMQRLVDFKNTYEKIKTDTF